MAKSGKVGRPRKYNTKEIKEIKEKFSKYIDDNDIPIIVEFAYINNISRQSLYEYEEFATLRKRSRDKKEANLEKGGLTGQLNVTMAIFSLKQQGWSDKHDIKHSGEMQYKVTLPPELEGDE